VSRQEIRQEIDGLNGISGDVFTALATIRKAIQDVS